MKFVTIKIPERVADLLQQHPLFDIIGLEAVCAAELMLCMVEHIQDQDARPVATENETLSEVHYM